MFNNVLQQISQFLEFAYICVINVLIGTKNWAEMHTTDLMRLQEPRKPQYTSGLHVPTNCFPQLMDNHLKVAHQKQLPVVSLKLLSRFHSLLMRQTHQNRRQEVLMNTPFTNRSTLKSLCLLDHWSFIGVLKPKHQIRNSF